MLAAPSIGGLVDHFGSRRLVVASILASLLGIAVLFGSRNSLVAICVGLTHLDIGVQASFVANQTRVFGFFNEALGVR